MTKYAIARQYLLPVYQHLMIEADSIEEACQKAIEHDDWDSSEQHYDSSRPTVITAIKLIPEGNAQVETDPGWFIYAAPSRRGKKWPRPKTPCRSTSATNKPRKPSQQQLRGLAALEQSRSEETRYVVQTRSRRRQLGPMVRQRAAL